MKLVTLSKDEILAAVVVAASRKIASDARRASGADSRRAEHYEEIRTWDQEIESSAAEMAVARWRDRYWSGASFRLDTPGTDAGGAQVRWTQHESGHLILYPEDALDAVYVFVTGRSPTFRIAGWIRGHEGKNDRFWRDDGAVKCPSWWVPQTALKEIP